MTASHFQIFGGEELLQVTIFKSDLHFRIVPWPRRTEEYVILVGWQDNKGILFHCCTRDCRLFKFSNVSPYKEYPCKVNQVVLPMKVNRLTICPVC